MRMAKGTIHQFLFQISASSEKEFVKKWQEWLDSNVFYLIAKSVPFLYLLLAFQFSFRSFSSVALTFSFATSISVPSCQISVNKKPLQKLSIAIMQLLGDMDIF